MSCFPCFTSQRNKKSNSGDDQNGLSGKDKGVKGEEIKHINAPTFTFRELATATKNFRQECLLGEGGFGRVYKGTIKSTGQVVAVKQLDRSGINGNKEFLSEVLTLSLLHHPNLVNLLGYCADGDQRLLVFEYMYGGSLEDHLLDIRPDKNPLDWFTRIRIALGIATGLEYLHETASPPVIYRDLKSSNILLDDDLNPKLSDFGGANLGSPGEKANVSSRAMGTYGYSAPEYTRTGQLTLKSDIYSYGVVMLELITGRRAIDTTRPNDEQNLVTWAQPFFRDPKKFPDLADPLLDGQFPEKDLNQAVAITAMCLQDEATARPLISDVVMTLSFLSTKPAEPLPTPTPAPVLAPALKVEGEKSNHLDAEITLESESETSDEEAREDGHDVDEDGSESSEYYEDVHASSTSRKSSSGSDDESDTSSRSGSSRKSSSGSNRLESPGRGGEGERAFARSSTMGSATNGEAFSMSRRTARMLSAPASVSVSGRRIPRNDSEMSLGMMSVCHEQSYSFGSQDGFVSLQKISSIGSSEGSVHSHLH